jgi:hypothetical protein
MQESVQYQNNAMQSGNFFAPYRTEMINAGMPTPVMVSWMPMPTCGEYKYVPETTWQALSLSFGESG